MIKDMKHTSTGGTQATFLLKGPVHNESTDFVVVDNIVQFGDDRGIQASFVILGHELERDGVEIA
jgi:hypothetical protein